MSKQPQPPSALCEQTQEAIIALLDNEYVPEQQALLAKHLPECPSCQAYQDSMQHLTLSLSQIDEVPVPEGLELRIMDRIAEESTQPGTRQTVSAGTGPRRGKWLKAAPIAAAALLLALGLPWLQHSMSTRQALEVESGKMVAKGKPVTINTANQNRNTGIANPNQSAQTLANRPEAVESNEAKAPEEVAAEQQIGNGNDIANGTEVASATPATLGMDTTYASSKEGDVYYDPVSNIVQF